jgi:hypothetical protein
MQGMNYQMCGTPTDSCGYQMTIGDATEICQADANGLMSGGGNPIQYEQGCEDAMLEG